MHVRTEKFIILRAYIGLGGFLVYRNIPFFFEEPVFRFCQTLNTEKPGKKKEEKDEKSENRHKNVEPAHFRE